MLHKKARRCDVRLTKSEKTILSLKKTRKFSFKSGTLWKKEVLEESTARRRLEVLRILLDEGNVDIDLSEPTEEELYRIYRKVTWSRYQGKDPEEQFDCEQAFETFLLQKHMHS